MRRFAPIPGPNGSTSTVARPIIASISLFSSDPDKGTASAPQVCGCSWFGAGELLSFSAAADVDEAEVLREAPDLTIGRNRVRLDGVRYQITIDLPADVDDLAAEAKDGDRAARVSGLLFVEPLPGRTLPPVTMRGADGWRSGYVVPVMAGTLGGTLLVDGEPIAFDGGEGYHDHNWGFWKGVSWQWGQVQYGDLSIVYGRVRPPPDAADPGRVPGLLAAFGPDGLTGYATNVSIEETNDSASGRPERIVVRGRSSSLDLTLNLAVDETVVTRTGGEMFGSGLDFLQLRAQYRVLGRAGDRTIDFTARGSAETFRGR